MRRAPRLVSARGSALALGLALALSSAACSRSAPDATPEGAVRLWIEKMESSGDDPRAMKEAYQLLATRTRTNLKDRADRASRGQGRRYEAHEMLAEGRFALKFRPKRMSARVEGDGATVDVRGDGADELASIRCAREGQTWRLELELPEPPPSPAR